MTMDVVAVRRDSDPVIVRQFFQAIESIRGGRQIANLNRIVRYMEREFKYEAKESLEHLHKAVTDGLVVETITVGCKGSKAGVEQEGYWIPDRAQILYEKGNETHDWYCFVCHNPGEVLPCSGCSLVYHTKCLNISASGNKKWMCPACCDIKKTINKENKQELARCLNFVANQQNDYTSELKKRLFDRSPFHDFFLYEYYDLKSLQKDCLKCSFSCVEEFHQKILLIQHNYSLLFGEDDKLTKLVKEFVKDSHHDLFELKLCKNCFFLSNTKPVKDWFCQPCNPPHQVVWAKQKGFEFWPSKVIQVEDDRIDVRFFGKHHPRAWVSIESVRSISVSPSELRVKRKQHWKQSSIEMKEYIRQCECALGKEVASKIILFNSPYGIGRNKVLLAAAESLGLQKNEELPSLNFNLNEKRIRNKKRLKATWSSSESMDSDNNHSSVHETNNVIDVVDAESSETLASKPRKRSSDSISTESLVGDCKIRRISGSSVLDCGTQTEGMQQCDQLTQVSPIDLDGDGAACSCRLRYGAILQKFKDYVIESNRLEKSRLIRAAAVKASYDQRQVEDRVRKDVAAMFEDLMAKLKEKHEEELKQVKLKQWCIVCLNEASIYCCKNINYCSIHCKERNYDTHIRECVISNVMCRPRRIIKPKAMD